jgi:transposase
MTPRSSTSPFFGTPISSIIQPRIAPRCSIGGSTRARTAASKASSERISRQIEQLELRLEELQTGEAVDDARAEAADPAPAPLPPERARPKRKPLPDNLPRRDVVHQPGDNAACTCPACGGKMAKLGEDVTEVLDYIPGHFEVIRHVRPKYACAACDAITQAPAPALPTPRGRATPAMLAHLLVAKYCDSLPLYRQAEIYAREGIELDRSTLCDWVGQAAWLLDPVVATIRRHVFAAEKIHGDDTPVPVLAPGLGRTKTGRLWVYVRDDRPFAGEAAPASTARTVAASIRPRTWPASPACSRPTAMPGSRRSTIPPAPNSARSSKSRVGPTAAARSSMFGKPRSRRSPRRRWTASPRSTPSRPRCGSRRPPSG